MARVVTGAYIQLLGPPGGSLVLPCHLLAPAWNTVGVTYPWQAGFEVYLSLLLVLPILQALEQLLQPSPAEAAARMSDALSAERGLERAVAHTYRCVILLIKM